MAEREIKIGFPEVKMEALEFFLKENDTTVEKVLREHLDKTYEKSVPQQVRKFVESKMIPLSCVSGFILGRLFRLGNHLAFHKFSDLPRMKPETQDRGEDREDAVPDSRPQERLF